MKLDLDRSIVTGDDMELRLADVVMHPRTRRVTHVVVEPRHDHPQAHLVPISYVSDATDGSLRLACTTDQLDAFPYVEQIEYKREGDFPVAEPGWAMGIQEVLTYPYHYDVEFSDAWYSDGYTVTWDRVPAGEVEIRRTSPVRSADGHDLGQVEGFVCDERDHVTHIVLEHGHFWGARDIVIPIGKVDRIENDRVVLSLATTEVGRLPEAHVRRGLVHRRS